jgi:FkbM family methyltransferase
MNLELNNARNVRLANEAAWHKEESVRIFTKPGNPSGTTTLMQDWAVQWHLDEHLEVAARPLAAILTVEEIKQARIIKIDVEGAEWNVVSGMEAMMPACRHDLEIVIEVSKSMLSVHGKSGQDLLSLFSGWGFHAYHIVNDYSPAAYLSHVPPPRPRRLERMFDHGDQMDVILSRIDAPML